MEGGGADNSGRMELGIVTLEYTVYLHEMLKKNQHLLMRKQMAKYINKNKLKDDKEVEQKFSLLTPIWLLLMVARDIVCVVY